MTVHHHRVRKLIDDEWAVVHADPERALRVHLTDFVGLAARLWYRDHPVTTVLRKYRDAWRHLDDPAQVRTGTDFERRSIECLRQLRPELGDVVDFAEAAPFDELDDAVDPLLRIPPAVLLGEVTAGSYFDLSCWNEANALVEGVQRPYRAARRIADMKIHEPSDVYGLIGPLTALVERYEDDPTDRPATAAAIMEVFSAYRDRAPWPVD